MYVYFIFTYTYICTNIYAYIYIYVTITSLLPQTLHLRSKEPCIPAKEPYISNIWPYETYGQIICFSAKDRVM